MRPPSYQSTGNERPSLPEHSPYTLRTSFIDTSISRQWTFPISTESPLFLPQRRYEAIGALGMESHQISYLLESHGVLCFALAEDCRELDAFSFWQLERPFVTLNTIKSGERGRWDAAHELGHLVLHRYEMTMGRQHELEADIFAQSFLLPPKAILASGLYQPSLHRVLEHRLAWQVSAIAFTRCLHGHNLLSDWHYRNLVIELSKRDYRSREPGGISRETSQLLPQALRHLAADGIRLPQIAESLDLPHSDLYEMMFSLVPVVAVPPAIDSR